MGVEVEYYDGPCKILDLPQDVLRILFSYLDSTALFHLSQTCNYLKEFVEDPVFWRYIDARDDPNIPEKLEYVINKVHGKSTHLFLHGNLHLYDLPKDFFNMMKPFQNLRVLALENLKLQGSKVTLKDFPSGLEELSLRRTYLKNSKYFFQHSVRNLPKLKVLILDECCWVTCSFLLSVSKYEHLEIISIIKCIRVHMNMIPYLNVSKFGCKKLKVVDCRFTGIGGDLIRTFFSSSSIQRLYSQSFKSGEVDYQEKIINYDNESKKRSPADTSTDLSISDSHLVDYATTSSKPKNEIEAVFDTVLYKDPYPECCCGGDGFGDGSGGGEVLHCDDENLKIPYGRGETKFVCNKHMKDVVDLPSSFRNFFLAQQRQLYPVSDADDDSDSEEDDDGGCCYFGMGSKIVAPSTHDRTPSRTEEMSLPEEGARNQSPRVLILNPLREFERENAGNNDDRPHNSRSRGNREGSGSTRKRPNSSDDSDSEVDELERKRIKLVSNLLSSAEVVRHRIEKIRVKNGMPPTEHRNSDSEEGPSHEGAGPAQAPSCSRNRTHERRPGGANGRAARRWVDDVSDDEPNDVGGRAARIGEGDRNREQDDWGVEAVNARNYVIFNDPDRRRLKYKIPLRRLSLRGYRKITNATLIYLKNIDLELLDLTYTSVTKQGIEDFLVHNPNCRVIHPLYCKCKPRNSLF